MEGRLTLGKKEKKTKAFERKKITEKNRQATSRNRNKYF